MARQFIYHMHGLSKAYAGGKKVLENVHLSFYPDAKIGVLGPNERLARAFAFLFVRPNPNSSLVTLDTTTFADDTPSDNLTVVQPPPLRRVCVPIVQ